MTQEKINQQQLKKIIAAQRKYKKIYDNNANVSKKRIAKAERDILALQSIIKENGSLAKLAELTLAALWAALTAAKEENKLKLAEVEELHLAAAAEAERLEREIFREE
ncbi:hypothetical protein [Rummeliibacillus pycnus]|uniref:hypothetical protein n=1 Tax=Rummeliibacillus pycnus TaxID=101070 RepID=UPI000C9BD867|nr:hypothetical protein [Rummeliibacillus pycnus]